MLWVSGALKFICEDASIGRCRKTCLARSSWLVCCLKYNSPKTTQKCCIWRVQVIHIARPSTFCSLIACYEGVTVSMSYKDLASSLCFPSLGGAFPILSCSYFEEETPVYLTQKWINLFSVPSCSVLPLGELTLSSGYCIRLPRVVALFQSSVSVWFHLLSLLHIHILHCTWVAWG